jgi:hypothetical protein
MTQDIAALVMPVSTQFCSYVNDFCKKLGAMSPSDETECALSTPTQTISGHQTAADCQSR